MFRGRMSCAQGHVVGYEQSQDLVPTSADSMSSPSCSSLLYQLTEFLQLNQVDTITSILQMRKKTHREVKSLDQGHSWSV